MELRNFLYHNLYFHPEINKLNEGSLEKMTLLFDTYRTNPELLGKKAQARIAVDGLPRAIADYIAGMTDNFCLDCANEILKPEHLNDEIEQSITGRWFDAR